jgi:glycosyltransferase involved in cell wall biosynthesis
MEKYLWIGAVGDKDYLTELVKLGCKQSTAYNVQDKLIQGIEKQNISIDTLSGHVVPPYPKYKKITVSSRKWKRTNNSSNIDVSFLNLPFINLYSKGRSLKKEALKWVKSHINNEKTIIVYSLHSPFLIAVCAAKKYDNKIKVVGIVPDLPEYMNSKQSKLRAFLKKIDRSIINKCIKQFDGFVLFAEAMKDRLPISDKPYTVMEGILNIDYTDYVEKIKMKNFNSSKTVIMITGALSKEDGIELLLDAFSKINDKDYELWITGTGSGEKLIYNYCEKDHRIKFYGYLDSYEDFINLQKQANIFVAMVPPTNPKSKYFFPSKIMEYLVTGSPVIAFKLESIPREYNQHMYFFENTDTQSIANKIIEVSNISSETKREMAYQRYDLLNAKTKETQGEKILKFIKGI